MNDQWTALLDAIQNVHSADATLCNFCPFPDDITHQPVAPFHIPSSDLLQQDVGLAQGPFKHITSAVKAAAPMAHWRQTYRGKNVSERFLDEFGCFCLIGTGGPFSSAQMNAWFVYMPANLTYPWHQHPAAELYYCLSGSADFFKQSNPAVTLTAGGSCYHSPNQPHAMVTQSSSVLAYVVWRDQFDQGARLCAPDDGDSGATRF